MFGLISTQLFSLLLFVLARQGTAGVGVVELAPPGTDFDELPFASSLNAGAQALSISIEVGCVSPPPTVPNDNLDPAHGPFRVLPVCSFALLHVALSITRSLIQSQRSDREERQWFGANAS